MTYSHGDTIPVTCPHCGAWMKLGTHITSYGKPDMCMAVCSTCGITGPSAARSHVAIARARRLAYGRHAGLVARVDRIVGWWWGQMRRCGG